MSRLRRHRSRQHCRGARRAAGRAPPGRDLRPRGVELVDLDRDARERRHVERLVHLANRSGLQDTLGASVEYPKTTPRGFSFRCAGARLGEAALAEQVQQKVPESRCRCGSVPVQMCLGRRNGYGEMWPEGKAVRTGRAASGSRSTAIAPANPAPARHTAPHGIPPRMVFSTQHRTPASHSGAWWPAVGASPRTCCTLRVAR
jgi:hypothetical protein